MIVMNHDAGYSQDVVPTEGVDGYVLAYDAPNVPDGCVEIQLTEQEDDGSCVVIPIWLARQLGQTLLEICEETGAGQR